MSDVRSCSIQSSYDLSYVAVRRRDGMLAAQRRARIVEELRRQGAVRVMEFAELLGVSDMTIRRGLDTPAQRGLVDKVHGGAFTTPNLLEAETDRAHVAAGRLLVVLADHTKPDQALAALQDHVGEVLLAPVGSATAGRPLESRP